MITSRAQLCRTLDCGLRAEDVVDEERKTQECGGDVKALDEALNVCELRTPCTGG